MIKTYYLLTKPGIILGNAITLAWGFALASKGHFDYWLFFVTTVGLSLVIASACVFNNYIDRWHDQKMERTKNRPLAKGKISGFHAIVFATCLGLSSLVILSLFTNSLALIVSFIGFFNYVVIYGIWKSRSIYGTAIGSLSGAMPPIVGYCAVSNQFDVGAFILLSILILWQMPHFFSIALYHFDDYVAADIPVFPVKKGIQKTKRRMVVYIVAFMISLFMLTLFGYTSYVYLIVAELLGIIWLGLCIKGFSSVNDKLWARSMFQFSLVTITILCLMITIER